MSLLRTVRNSEVDARVQCLRSMDEDSKLTYGELQPAFAYRLLEDEKLDHKSCFVDLGSGIGNLVIQAAVQCGCKAFGIELREDLHAVAVDSLAFAQSQCFQRGIHMGTVHLLQGDMLNSAPVQTWISSADVLFVNNKAFDATLNQRILDSLLIKLKHGAVIVSTMVFIESKRLRNGKTRAILPDGLQKGSVSWADAAGVYYWHRIYKEGEQHIKQDTLDSIFYQR
ncbi:S-adenosyl-L-methionine-dependent methyltransferase [Schizophyllum commune Tattone D]|nr:S-adenosyl-L-methionine-dependent methyltransferase [Schizophyllum commune Tattone D]